jgi:hypothetical protein
VAIYKTQRTSARPPFVLRLPRLLPLSLLNGAVPTRAAICLRLQTPSSGRVAINVAAVIFPTPGVLINKAFFCLISGVFFVSWSISLSSSASCSFSEVIMLSIYSRISGSIFSRRFLSAVSISKSCLRRLSKAARCFSTSPGRMVRRGLAFRQNLPVLWHQFCLSWQTNSYLRCIFVLEVDLREIWANLPCITP